MKDSPMKKQLLSKLDRKSGGAGGGLHDEFQVSAKGRIMIEEIDEDGQVVGVLADKKNLVVDGAEHILLRSFAGDTERTLYRNRIPKAANGVSPKYHIRLDKALTEVVSGQSTIAHSPNVIWSGVNEDDFETEYAFNPITLFVKEETSNEPGQVAFSISKTAVTGSVPLQAEIYSGYSNYFIGIGDGVKKEMPLDDTRIIKSGFALDSGKLTATVQGSTLKIEEKLSHVSFLFEKSNKGGQVEIKVNDQAHQTVETYDSNLATGETEDLLVEVSDLDFDSLQKVELTFAGADSGVTGPKIVVKSIETDALQKKDNTLIREFKNFENRFDTVEIYNTMPTPDENGHYVFRLLNFPVVKDSVKLNYDTTSLQEVDEKSKLSSGKFFVDHVRGYVYMSEAMTGLAVTFTTTNEFYEDQRENLLVSKNVTANDVKSGVVGAIDGVNRTFQPSGFVTGIGTVSGVRVYVNGVLTSSGISVAGQNITFSPAPAVGTVIEVEFNYSIPVRSYTLAFKPSSDIKVYDKSQALYDVALATKDLAAAGTAMLNPLNDKEVLISTRVKDGSPIGNIDLTYGTDERPGVPTGYKRAVILKPKKMNEYPWFALDRGEIQFVAEFKENTPMQAVTIREMGLFDGPRLDDSIRGFKNYPVSAFSLVRVAPTRKDTKTGMRVTWTITLTDEDGKSFKG
ncbi:hypothetical protein C0431_13215 [bacterium]|nr:hypothetical protein [bacterium]